MKSSQFISIWGSMAGLARAIDEGETTVRNWFIRGSIPPRYDGKLMAAAGAMGRKVTPVDLHALREDIADRAKKTSGAAA